MNNQFYSVFCCIFSFSLRQRKLFWFHNAIVNKRISFDYLFSVSACAVLLFTCLCVTSKTIIYSECRSYFGRQSISSCTKIIQVKTTTELTFSIEFETQVLYNSVRRLRFSCRCRARQLPTTVVFLRSKMANLIKSFSAQQPYDRELG